MFQKNSSLINSITLFSLSTLYLSFKKSKFSFKLFSLPKTNRPLRKENVSIFSGNANIPLAKEVASYLGLSLSKHISNHFADGECNIELLDPVSGRDCYIIQPMSTPVNENLMELIITIGSMKRANAKKITAVIPYYGYARADRKVRSRIPISAADVAKMLEVMGVNRVMAVDLHCGQIQGFFSPQTNVVILEAQGMMVDYLLSKNIVEDLQKLVIVSPDAGGVYRTKTFADLLRKKSGADPIIAMVTRETGRPNEVAKMELVGDVEGSDCVIVDDMIDTGATMCLTASLLKQHGARNVYAFATHGLFNKDACKNIDNSALDRVIVTNTVLPKGGKVCKKVDYISIGSLIAEAIKRIENNELIDVF